MTPLRRFHALYCVVADGDRHFYWREFLAEDFFHAVDQARDATEEGEELVAIQEIR